MARSLKFVVEQTNELARQFYLRLGYEEQKGFRFDESQHPTELAMWFMACDAQLELTDTDVIEWMDEGEDEGEDES